MLSTLDIKLLGGFCLSCADKPVVGVTTERPQSLLAYLVLPRDIPQTLQRLAFQFWADSTEAQASTNLRRELHHLRQGLPDNLSYLAMTELEAGGPAAALPYCQEMAIVAAKIKGEGSERAVANALLALAHYQLQQIGADAALERAIATLQQVDAKRMLSYVLIGAAQVDLECDQTSFGNSPRRSCFRSCSDGRSSQRDCSGLGNFDSGCFSFGRSRTGDCVV